MNGKSVVTLIEHKLLVSGAGIPGYFTKGTEVVDIEEGRMKR